MTLKKEPLLVKFPSGWGWGVSRGVPDAERPCLLDRLVGAKLYWNSPVRPKTKVGKALQRVDNERGTTSDRRIILRLAKRMGVSS